MLMSAGVQGFGFRVPPNQGVLPAWPPSQVPAAPARFLLRPKRFAGIQLVSTVSGLLPMRHALDMRSWRSLPLGPFASPMLGLKPVAVLRCPATACLQTEGSGPQVLRLRAQHGFDVHSQAGPHSGAPSSQPLLPHAPGAGAWTRITTPRCPHGRWCQSRVAVHGLGVQGFGVWGLGFGVGHHLPILPQLPGSGASGHPTSAQPSQAAKADTVRTMPSACTRHLLPWHLQTPCLLKASASP